MFDPLLEEIQQPEEGGPLRHLDVQQLARSMFSQGALPETPARNRAVLYALSEGLERALARRLRKEGKGKGLASVAGGQMAGGCGRAGGEAGRGWVFLFPLWQRNWELTRGVS
jgi:hypothetical protein